MPEILTGESLNLQEVLNDPTVLIVAHLAKNDIPPDFDKLLLADLVECDFDGYSPIEIMNWDVFQHEDEFLGEAVSEPLLFTAGDAIVPQRASALYLVLYHVDEQVNLWRVYPLEPEFFFDVPGRELLKQIRVSSYDDTATPP